MAESAALALGCTVFPAGVGNTELQLQAIADLRPSCYVGTPSFLRTLIEKAAEREVRRCLYAPHWSPAKRFRPRPVPG
jgi:phenylacetate-CoA ligase